MPKPATIATCDRLPGVIRPDELYTLPEVGRRLGLKGAAMRAARRDGLKMRQVGRCRYLLGSDVIAYVAAKPPVTD